MMAQNEGLVMCYILFRNGEKLKRSYEDVMAKKTEFLPFLPLISIGILYEGDYHYMFA